MPNSTLPVPDDLISKVERFVRSLPAPVPDPGVRVLAAHPVYLLGLDGVRDRDLSSAKHVGWRFLLADDTKTIGYAEASHIEPVSVVFDDGGVAGGLVQRAEAASNAHELRLLRIPQLHTTAMWLYESGASKLILAPATDRLVLNAAAASSSPLTETDFFTAVHERGIVPFNS